MEDRIGEEGKGFEYILHGMNPERILVAAEAVGIGRTALARAARYAKRLIVVAKLNSHAYRFFLKLVFGAVDFEM